MKKISLILASIFMTFSVASASAQDLEEQSTGDTIKMVDDAAAEIEGVDSADEASLWDNANSEYSSGDYSAAILAYERMLDEGQKSWEVYYNLGAAYFKAGQIGRAILNTERAARLSPANDDVEHNLDVLRAHTQDRIDALPQFFLVDWAESVRDSISPNSWTVGMIVLLVAAALCFVGWYTTKRSVFMASCIVVVVLALSSWGFAHSAYSAIEGGNSAIVLNSATVVRSSPDANGKELYILHQGTKVDIEDSYGIYSEVVVASGNKGWVATKDIETI